MVKEKDSGNINAYRIWIGSTIYKAYNKKVKKTIKLLSLPWKSISKSREVQERP